MAWGEWQGWWWLAEGSIGAEIMDVDDLGEYR